MLPSMYFLRCKQLSYFKTEGRGLQWRYQIPSYQKICRRQLIISEVTPEIWNVANRIQRSGAVRLRVQIGNVDILQMYWHTSIGHARS